MNDTLTRPFLGPDMTDLQYQRNRMKPHFFRLIQLNVYLIVIFRGHFNDVQAKLHVKFSKMPFFFFFTYEFKSNFQ